MRVCSLPSVFRQCNGVVSRLFMAAAVVVVATPVAARDGGGVVDISVLESTPDRIVVSYTLGDYVAGSVRIDGRTYSTLSLGDESQILASGFPDVPNICRSIIIPDDREMAVRVLSSRFYDIEDFDLVPSKGSILRTVDPSDVPYTFGKVYSTDALYPAEPASLRDPYILRDHRGLVIDVNPFQYNPVRRTLRVYTSIDVEVTPAGPGRINVMHGGGNARSLSLAFHKIYSGHFLNYAAQQRYVPLDEDGDMLVICHDAWLPNIQPLVTHKNAIGLTTTVVGVSTIPGGNNATAIKDYILNLYNTGDLAFVLLVGDGPQVVTPDQSGGSSDPTYAQLAGSDKYPEIVVGRFSAETAAQVDTQVERTIEYEQMPATAQPWFKRGTCIASDEGAGIGDDGEADYVHAGYMRDDLMAYGYTLVDEVYDPGASSATVTAAVNAGRGIMTYTGHGSTTQWVTTGFSNSNVNALTNDNMLPFVFSVACVNGQFDGYTCFAEAWMRATNASEPTGAIGFYGHSVNCAWAEPMASQDESVDLLVGEAYFSFGALCYAGSCRMMDDYVSTGGGQFDTWNVFGDPSVRVFGTAAPATGLKTTPSGGFSAAGPAGGPFTPGSKVYTLENLNGSGIDYSVTASQPWITITNGSGSLAPLSTTDVTVSVNAAADSLGNGNYSDTITITNTTNGDGDTTRGAFLQVGVPTLVLEYPMVSDPLWSSKGQWAFGDPTGQGGVSYGNPDPDTGATGANVCGVNLGGDYSTTVGGPYLLTTGAMDLTDVQDVTLKFQRWLNTDYVPYVSATIEASNDGINWTLVWNNSTSEIADSSWSQYSYDISAVADDQSTVYIRWGYSIDTSGAFAYSGWNIDDVQIWGLVTSAPVTCATQGGDMDSDDDVDGDDLQGFVQCYLQGDPATAGCVCADMDASGSFTPADVDAMVDCAVGAACP